MELVIKDISAYYGKSKALSNISAHFSSGEVIGLIGANGAGKTTLIKIIATLRKPDSGDVFLDGESITKNPFIMKRVIGYLPQQVAVYPNLNAKEFLQYMASIKGISNRDAKIQINELMKLFHLEDVGKKSLSEFSGGMKQKVGIITALLGNPEVIIVDEPTTGLDPQERVTLRNLLSELARQKIVLLSTHIVSDIEITANRLFMLNRGLKCFEGTPEELIHKAEGTVWETLITQEQLLSVRGNVSSLTQTEKGMYAHIISDEIPIHGAAKVRPSLEDACLSVLGAAKNEKFL